MSRTQTEPATSRSRDRAGTSPWPTFAVAGCFVVAMLGTTLPTPLYPLYESRFGFAGLTVTVVFATYAAGVIASLLLFGQASDVVGRKRLLLPGLVLSGLSACAFLLAPSFAGEAVPVLLVGRALSGLSAGIYTGTATATLVDLAREERRPKAALVAALVNMLGLGLGPFLAGWLVSLAPYPTRLVYGVDLLLVVAALAALASVPEPHPPAQQARWRLQRPRLPSGHRAAFTAASLVGLAGFAVLGLFTAVAPLFLAQVIDRGAAWLCGVVVATVFAASAVGQVLSQRLRIHTGLVLGCLALTAGVAAVGASLLLASLPLLIVGGVVAGFGQGTGFRTSLQAVTRLSADEERGQVVSTFFTILYLAIAAPIVGLGVLTQVWTLVAAGSVFAAVVAAVALVLVGAVLSRPQLFERA